MAVQKEQLEWCNAGVVVLARASVQSGGGRWGARGAGAARAREISAPWKGRPARRRRATTAAAAALN